MRTRVFLALVTFIGISVTAGANTIKKLNLEMGSSDETTISKPVYSSEGVASVVFAPVEKAYDTKAPIVRRATKKLFVRGVEYDLDSSIDLAAMFTEALASQAGSMGLDTATHDDSWGVNVSLNEVFLESKQIPYGPVLFYGFMQVAVDVRRADGETQTIHLRLSQLIHRFNAGMGRKDEAAEALAGFLIQSAQEVVARLNREFFRAPSHPSIAEALVAIKAHGIEDRESDMLRIGLSGSRESVPDLLSLLQQEKDESDRVHVINALANIGDPDAEGPLAARYPTEDEDCRLYILKAMEYIGGNDAMDFIEKNGIGDDDVACRSLASWLTS